MLVRNLRYLGHNRGSAEVPKSLAKSTDWHTTLPRHTEKHVYYNGNLFFPVQIPTVLMYCTVRHYTNPEISYSRLVKENMRPVGPMSSLRTVEQSTCVSTSAVFHSVAFRVKRFGDENCRRLPQHFHAHRLPKRSCMLEHLDHV